MQVTRSQLKNLIKEAINESLSEGIFDIFKGKKGKEGKIDQYAVDHAVERIGQHIKTKQVNNDAGYALNGYEWSRIKEWIVNLYYPKDYSNKGARPRRDEKTDKLIDDTLRQIEIKARKEYNNIAMPVAQGAKNSRDIDTIYNNDVEQYRSGQW